MKVKYQINNIYLEVLENKIDIYFEQAIIKRFISSINVDIQIESGNLLSIMKKMNLGILLFDENNRLYNQVNEHQITNIVNLLARISTKNYDPNIDIIVNNIANKVQELLGINNSGEVVIEIDRLNKFKKYLRDSYRALLIRNEKVEITFPDNEFLIPALLKYGIKVQNFEDCNFTIIARPDMINVRPKYENVTTGSQKVKKI